MHTHAERWSTARIQTRVGAVLTTLVAILLLVSASTKLAHVPSVVSQLAAAGITDQKLIFVAALEVLSALLFLMPSTRSAGLLFVSAFLGGAIATHLQHGESIMAPSMVLGLIWVGSWLRHPQILWSWRRGGSSAGTGEVQ